MSDQDFQRHAILVNSATIFNLSIDIPLGNLSRTYLTGDMHHTDFFNMV